MKTKHCKVDLVADSIKQLGNWIEAIDEQFDDVNYTEIRTVDWRSQKEVGIDFDYRCTFYCPNRDHGVCFLSFVTTTSTVARKYL